MKKMYQKPQAEIVIVRCKDKLLDYGAPTTSEFDLDHTDAKEMEMRLEEEQEMHEELGNIFSSDNLVDPWK